MYFLQFQNFKIDLHLTILFKNWILNDSIKVNSSNSNTTNLKTWIMVNDVTAKEAVFGKCLGIMVNTSHFY